MVDGAEDDVLCPVVVGIIGGVLPDVVGIRNILEDPAAVPVPCPPLPVASKNIKNIHCILHGTPTFLF